MFETLFWLAIGIFLLVAGILVLMARTRYLDKKDFEERKDE